MPLFYYTSKNKNGDIQSDSIQAVSLEEAQNILSRRDIEYYNLIEQKKASILSWQTITRKNILFFTRYFSVLLKAGVSVFKALNILEKQERNITFRQKITVIRQEVESGKNLFQAFYRFVDVFGSLYCNLVRIGEETGRLSDIMDRMADYIESARDLKKRIISILIYPIIVSTIIFFITMFLFTIIVPKFSELYWQLGITKDYLPWITVIMMKISDIIRDYFIWELIAIILTFASIMEVYKSKAGRFFIDDMLLRVPIVGQMIIRYNMSIFSMNLSILFEAGYSVLRSFDMAIEIISNVSLKRKMSKIIVSLESGKNIAQSFREVEAIPVLAVEMIEIGEETASFDKMLKYISEFYDKELKYAVDTFVSLIEPTLIIVLGIIVLLVLLAIYLPIFNLAASIKVH